MPCRGAVHHLLFIRRLPRNHVRRIRSLTLSKPLNVPHMGYRGTELAHDYFDYLTSHPLDSAPIVLSQSHAPLSGHYGSHIRIAASFELRSFARSSFHHILGSSCSCSTASTVTSSMAFSPLVRLVWFFPTLICARLSVCSYSRSCTRPSLPSCSRTRLFASGSASCGTWTVCAGVC